MQSCRSASTCVMAMEKYLQQGVENSGNGGASLRPNIELCSVSTTYTTLLSAVWIIRCIIYSTVLILYDECKVATVLYNFSGFAFKLASISFSSAVYQLFVHCYCCIVAPVLVL